MIVGSQLFDLPAEVRAFTVRDSASYFDRKIREDVLLWKQRYKIEIDENALDIQTVEGYLGEAYGVAGQEIFDLIAELGRTEGLLLDPVYTGKAFYGMLSELAKGASGRLPGAKQVVFVHTGGLFGLFPLQHGFACNKGYAGR